MSFGDADEIASLVGVICQQASTPEARRAAEKRLLLIQRDSSNWRHSLRLLSTADDNVVFFVSQGLQHFVWAHWRDLQPAEKAIISSEIINIIEGRGQSMSQYARSKVEQVLAAVCALSESLSPALSLVKEPGSPGVEVGLSTLRTVCEELLSDDKRLTIDCHLLLVGEVAKVAAAAMSLSCRICADVLRSGAADGPLLHLSLDVMKLFISKLPVGPHLSAEALDILCALAERGIDSSIVSMSLTPDVNGPSFRCAKHCRSATLAIRTLMELMFKKYIPRDASTGADSGAAVFINLIAKVVALLERYKPVCNHSDNAEIILPLLELVKTFVESHLERCIASANGNAAMGAIVSTFLDDFGMITLSFTEVELLLNAACVWETLLAIPSISSIVLTSESTLRVGLHLLRQSLTCNNEDLAVQSMDIVDEMELAPITNPEMREIVFGAAAAASSGRNVVEGAEEVACLGTSLLATTGVCVNQLLESRRFFDEVKSLVPIMLEQSFHAFALSCSNGSAELSAHALDVLYLSRLLPVFGNAESIIDKLVSMLLLQVEREYYRCGRAVAILMIQMFQLVGSICFSCRGGGSQDGQFSVMSASFNASVPLLRCMMYLLGKTTGPFQQTSEEDFNKDIQISACCCFLQLIMGLPSNCFSELVENTPDEAERPRQMPFGGYVMHAVEQMLGLFSSLPTEISTLLYCIASRLSPDVPVSMVRSLGGLVSALLGSSDGSSAVAMSSWNDSQIIFIAQTSAALCAIVKLHLGLDPSTRTQLLSSLAGLDDVLPPIASSSFRGVISLHIESKADGMSKMKKICTVLSKLMSLLTGLLQTFGRKSFGPPACTVMAITADALVFQSDDNATGLDIVLSAPDGEGLVFLKLLTVLISSLACGTSNVIPTSHNELELSHRLLVIMTGKLSNAVICAELLGDMIQAGWTVVTCHWPKMIRVPGVEGQSPAPACSIDKIMPTIGLLVQLFIGCLSSPSIPPQHSVLVIEGFLHSNEKFRYFESEWFQSNFLGVFLEHTINAILLDTIPGHSDTLECLLETICTDVHLAIWPVFKDISGKIASGLNCNPSTVSRLIAEEEGKAIRRSEGEISSSTSSERTSKEVRGVFSGMKAVLAVLASEITRCKEPVGFT